MKPAARIDVNATAGVTSIRAPSHYETTAIQQIHARKNTRVGWIRWTWGLVTKPIDAVGWVVMKLPGINWLLANILGGALSFLNNLAAWTTRRRAILAAFDRPAASLAEVHQRDLSEADAAAGMLVFKYQVLAGVSGAMAGASSNLGPWVGGPAIGADITALLGLNLRAVAELATYYGFDVRHQEERLFALELLSMNTSNTEAGKAVAMVSLVHIARDVAQKKAWKELEKHMFVQVMRNVAKALTIQLTKAKLAQLLPVVGAFVGAAYNAYYTASVCRNAQLWYRERFLARKYGPEVIEAVVLPDNAKPLRDPLAQALEQAR